MAMGSSSTLEKLPQELQASIQSHLSNFDIKRLRLASRKCSECFQLRADRVCLSANSRNIQVLRAIADHPIYRLKIQELVWDDARLLRKPTNRGRWPDDSDSDLGEDDDDDKEENPRWFRIACKRSIAQMQESINPDGPLPHHIRKRDRLNAAWGFEKCWEYYQQLLTDEDEVLKSGSDAEALRYGLKQFPNLQRIIITPSAHGILFLPAYQTPMIRSFPAEFLYPIPRTWPNNFEHEGDFPTALPWNDNPENANIHDVEERQRSYGSGQEYRELWRGYSIVLETLSHVPNNISEFIIDTRAIETGVNCYAVCDSCPEQANFARLCAKPGLRRLDLAIFLNGTEYLGFAPLRSGKLYSIFASAKDLRHFHFSSNLEMDESGAMAQLDPFDEVMDKHFVPLQSIFPIDTWSNLLTFCISKFLVLASGLVGFLGHLPRSVRFLELNFLLFLQEGTYRGLLDQMLQQLDWRTRSPETQPGVSVTVPPPPSYYGDTKAVTVHKPINEFLYRDGLNPFSTDEGNYVDFGVGAVEWDWYDPEQRRLYEDSWVQRGRGYHGWMDWNARSSR